MAKFAHRRLARAGTRPVQLRGLPSTGWTFVTQISKLAHQLKQSTRDFQSAGNKFRSRMEEQKHESWRTFFKRPHSFITHSSLINSGWKILLGPVFFKWADLLIRRDAPVRELDVSDLHLGLLCSGEQLQYQRRTPLRVIAVHGA